MSMFVRRGLNPGTCRVLASLCSVLLVQAAHGQPSSDFVLSPANSTNPSGNSVTKPVAMAGGATYTPAVEILGNGTAGTDDDLVEENVGSTDCTIRWTNAGDDPDHNTSLAVVLNNTSNNLAFTGAGTDGNLSLSLPSDGSTVTFNVTGVAHTNNMGTAVINAHKNNVHTAIIGHLGMTVFYFTDAHATLQVGDAYVQTTGTNAVDGSPTYHFGPPSGVGITMHSTVGIRPTAVSTTAPQVAKYKVGLVQNSNGMQVSVTLSSPTVLTNLTAGQIQAHHTIQITASAPGNLVDSSSQGTYSPPLYNSTDAASEYPAPGSTTTDTDAPNYDFPTTRVLAVDPVTGAITGSYGYNNCVGTLAGDFTDYAVLLDTSNTTVRPFRQIGWHLLTFDFNTNTLAPLASDRTTTQHITKDSSDSAYTSGIVTTGSTTNQTLNPPVQTPSAQMDAIP